MRDSELPATDWWQRHETNVLHDEPVRFDLFVRTLGAPIGTHRRQSAILERIERLDRRDAIDTGRVTVWGDSVCVSACCADRAVVRSIRDRIESFREWSRTRRDVATAFDSRAVRSSITGEQFDVIDLPTICLAVYVESSLEGLFPITVGDQELTIESYLEWFEGARDLPDSAPLVDT